MTERIVVLGAGGFGRETLDVIEAINADSPGRRWDVLGVLDDAPAPVQLSRLAARRVSHLGALSDAGRYRSRAKFVIAIGSPFTRTLVAERLQAEDAELATLVHPRAIIGSGSIPSKGSIVCAGVLLSTNVFLDENVHLNPGAIIGHDSTLGACVSVNPGAVVSGEVRIAERVMVGAAATILQGRHIGSEAVVGAGACVTRDVEPRITVIGVPARRMGPSYRGEGGDFVEG